MNAREVALSVLRDVFPAAGNARGAQESLDYRSTAAKLDARDRAFATTCAFGAIKMRRALDWYLHPYLRERKQPLPPAIAEILRLGTYELRYLSSAPHAVVSEWVTLAKKYGHRGTAGLVNAVLRSLLRDAPSAPAREDFVHEDDYLGTLHSYPTWVVRRLRESFGDERLEAILEGANAPAQAAVAINRTRTTREALAQALQTAGVRAEPSTLAEDALLVDDAAAVRAEEQRAGGAWWIQSETSAAVVDVLNPQPGERIADACSGRGSKALQIAARLNGDGSLTCIERDVRKLQALERRANEAGLMLASVAGDAAQPILPGRQDRVLLDAPCTAIGILGRHPEARWHKSADDAERLAVLQYALLERLCDALNPGGALVYAVCSFDRREGLDVIERTLRSQPVERGLLPAALREFETEEGDILIPPGIGGRDGFFVARLERRA